MKKITFLACFLLASILSFGQDNKAKVKEASAITFFGVDFSKAKAYGVKELPYQLREAYLRINMLFTAEAKKYNIPMYFGKSDVTNSFESVNKNNAEMKDEDVISNTKKNTLTSEQISALIKGYKTEGQGVGLVFVAERLDKQDELGYYKVVFFDLASKDVLYSKAMVTKAAGFGVRNYWANTVHRILKEWNY